MVRLCVFLSTPTQTDITQNSSDGPLRQAPIPPARFSVRNASRLDADDAVRPARPSLHRPSTSLELTLSLLDSAAEFSRSAIARDSDFSTNSTERGTFYMQEKHTGPAVAEWDDAPERRGTLSEGGGGGRTKRTRKVRGKLLIQFAANDPVQLADAAELAKPWVDGIDLNCGASSLLFPSCPFPQAELFSLAGCPQKWAYQEGIGCALLRKPELVRNLVRSTKQRLGWNFPVAVKIRVDDDPRCVLLCLPFLLPITDDVNAAKRTLLLPTSSPPVPTF